MRHFKNSPKQCDEEIIAVKKFGVNNFQNTAVMVTSKTKDICFIKCTWQMNELQLFIQRYSNLEGNLT